MTRGSRDPSRPGRSSRTITRSSWKSAIAFMSSSIGRRDCAHQPGQPPQSATPQALRTRSTAVAMYLHNRTGSLSPASSVTQASGAARLAHQALHRRGLPVARRRGDERQLRVLAGIENLEDVPSLNHPTALPWRRQLRLGQRQLVDVRRRPGLARAGGGAALVTPDAESAKPQASGIPNLRRGPGRQSVARSFRRQPTQPRSCDGRPRPRCRAWRRSDRGSSGPISS